MRKTKIEVIVAADPQRMAAILEKRLGSKKEECRVLSGPLFWPQKVDLCKWIAFLTVVPECSHPRTGHKQGLGLYCKVCGKLVD